MLGPLTLSSSSPAYSVRCEHTLDHCLMSRGTEKVAAKNKQEEGWSNLFLALPDDWTYLSATYSQQ